MWATHAFHDKHAAQQLLTWCAPHRRSRTMLGCVLVSSATHPWTLDMPPKLAAWTTCATLAPRPRAPLPTRRTALLAQPHVASARTDSSPPMLETIALPGRHAAHRTPGWRVCHRQSRTTPGCALASNAMPLLTLEMSPQLVACMMYAMPGRRLCVRASIGWVALLVRHHVVIV